MSTPSKGYDSWTPKLTAAQSALFKAQFPVFKYWAPTDVADANSLRCCYGIGSAPRCEKKATYIPEIWNGMAYCCCRHIPIAAIGFENGSKICLPLRCVRVER